MILLLSRNNELTSSFLTDLRREGFSIEKRGKTKDIGTFLHKKPEIQMIIIDLENLQNEATGVFHRIKQDPQLHLTPIICIIQKDLILEQLIAFELGADDFIYYPYTTLELQLKMRSLQGLLNLQSQLKEQENRLRNLRQTQRVFVTLNHYINNSLTPLYSLVQTVNEESLDDLLQLKYTSQHTIEFIKNVLNTLNNLIHSGEFKSKKNGIYRDLILDIENELRNLQKSKY
jgi:response regulator RpfG family c-di-GMP phosphodiesterase